MARSRTGLVGTTAVRLREPTLHVASADRRRAEKLVAEVKRRKKRIASDFYEMGKALAQLAEPRAYRALGHDTFEDLLHARRLLGRMQAHKLIEVARAYPKPIALKLGIEKAYLLARYVDRTPADDLAAELARRDVRVGGTKISRASVADLRAAVRRLDSPSAGAPIVSTAARRRAREVQRALRERGARTARVRARADGARVVLEVRVDLEESDALIL